MGGFFNDQAAHQMWFLCRNADRAIVCVAGPHGNAANGLHGRIGNGDSIGTKCKCFHEICRFAQSARNYQRDILSTGLIEMSSRPRKGGDGWHGNIIPEDDGRCPRAAATAIKDHIVHPDLQRRINVLFDVLCRQFIADRNATRSRPNLIGKIFDLRDLSPFGEARR